MPIENIRVLIVEDNVQDAANLKATLEGRTEVRFIVDMASSKKEAIAKLKMTEFDAVLLDLRLPDDEGVPLVKSVVDATREPGIVVLTGWGFEMESRIKAAGADDFLTKPIDPTEVSKRLQYVVIDRRHKAERHAIEAPLAEMGSIVMRLVDPTLLGK